MGSTRVWLRVDSGDDEEREHDVLLLQEELRSLGVAVERPSAGTAPPGSKAVEWAAIGAVLVTIAGSPVLASLIDAVSAWLGDRRQRRLRLEIDGDPLELSGGASAEQQARVDAWVRRHSGVGRHALIVANFSFADPGLRALRAPAHDAERLADVLSDPRIGGFSVRTLLNASAAEVIEAVADFFAERDPDDLLLLHFSGHGVKDESGELYFAAASTRMNRLAGTAVAADFVTRMMNRTRSRRVVLLLDCCYAGAFARGMVARAGGTVALDEQFGGTGRAVITASSAIEYAFEGQDLADGSGMPSVFTSALVEGLDTGDADGDQDGYVGLDELYDYVYERVRQVTPHQTPGKWVLDFRGDLRIARRARPVTSPSPLPDELREAFAHPLPAVREGAASELARLLAGQHQGLSLAARRELERLADDDSRKVAAAAAKALGSRPKKGTVKPDLADGTAQQGKANEQAPPPQERSARHDLHSAHLMEGEPSHGREEPLSDIGRSQPESAIEDRQVQPRPAQPTGGRFALRSRADERHGRQTRSNRAASMPGIAEHWAWRLAVRGSAAGAAIGVGIGGYNAYTRLPESIAPVTPVWSLFHTVAPLVLVAAGLIVATAPAARRKLPAGLLVGTSSAVLVPILARQDPPFAVSDVPLWLFGSWITVTGAVLALVAGALDSLAREPRLDRALGAATAVLILIPVASQAGGWQALVYVLACATAVALVLRWRVGERLPWSFALLGVLVADLAIFAGAELTPIIGAGMCVMSAASLALRDPTVLLTSRLTVVIGLLAAVPLLGDNNTDGEYVPHMLLCMVAAAAALNEFYAAAGAAPLAPAADSESTES